MGTEWEPPKWRREGRTGPGPAAPKYAKAKDRNTVRKGGEVGSQNGRKPPNPHRVPKSHGKRPSAPSPRQGKSDCCPMVAAGRSAKRGQFRLARRYAAMSVRLIAAKAVA